MDIRDVAQLFSTGKFEPTYASLSDKTVWEIKGAGACMLDGKEAIMKACTDIGAYFSSVSTYFTIENMVTEHNKVFINGTAEFRKGSILLSRIHSCDLYIFNEASKLVSIQSYCIADQLKS